MLLIGLLVLLAVCLALIGLWLTLRPRSRLASLVAHLDAPPQPRGLGERLLRRPAQWARPLVQGVVGVDLASRLRWAGQAERFTPEEFYGLKLVLAAGLSALVVLLPGTGRLLLSLVSLVIGFVGPDLWLSSLIKRRQLELEGQLEPFIELTATALEAGLSLGEAVRRVAQDSSGLLAAEFQRATAEMAAGKARRQAWQDLAARHTSEELRATVTAMLQAEAFGTSVAAGLRRQVAQLRIERQQRAQQLAQAATVKLRFPMFFFILVPFMAVLLAPAFLSLAASFGR